MIDSGLRVGEVCRLMVGDLVLQNLAKRAIDIDKRIAEKGCTRIVPLTMTAIETINHLWVSKWNYINAPYDSYAFFDWNPTKAITTRQIQRIIKSAGRKALGRDIHPHILRHTFATRLMRVTSTPTVQRLLGHKNLSSTQVYTHPDSDDLQKAIDHI